MNLENPPAERDLEFDKANLLRTLEGKDIPHDHPTVGPNARKGTPHESLDKRTYLALQEEGKIRLIMTPDGKAVWRKC